MNKEQQHESQFIIQRLYLKDTSFEAPAAPKVFQQQWQPELNLDIHTEHSVIEPNVYEVVLTVTATVKNANAVAFLAEVKQAGIFTIQHVPEQQLDHLLGSFCPNILFPYARETITTHVLRGSFPQLILAPINFDTLYMQQLEAKKNEKANEETEGSK